MRLIPGKTKVGLELFKGMTLKDIGIYVVTAALIITALVSNLPKKLYLAGGIFLLVLFLTLRLDSEPGYAYLLNILMHYFRRRRFQRGHTDEMLLKEAAPAVEEFASQSAEQPKAQAEEMTTEQDTAKVPEESDQIEQTEDITMEAEQEDK